MAVRRGGGALAALALAGLAYLFKNRKQVTGKVQEMTNRAQHQLGGSNQKGNTSQTSTEPQAYTGETTRM
jgi:hypothetical protein